MKKVKRILASVIATFSILLPLAMPVAVSAQNAQENIDENLSCGANLDFSSPSSRDCEEAQSVKAGDRVDNVVTSVINVMSLIVGAVAVVMLIVGGLRYVTSNGDSGQVGNAKNTILYAIIGIVIVALSQVVVRFVVDRATEV